MMTQENSECTDYDNVIKTLFFKKYEDNKDTNEVEFSKEELEDVNSKLYESDKIRRFTKNIPDIIYTYRSRRALPKEILATGHWIIKPKGKSNYSFIKTKRYPFVKIQEGLASIEILNSLPEIVEAYVANDEQGLLSSIRYNRMIDIFTDLTCFHLHSHIRTTIKDEGQIEIDDIYVGVDQEGIQYILPLEAKSPDVRDKLGWVQIANLVRYSQQNFPKLICRPLAAKPMPDNNICLIEFEDKTDYEDIGIKNIKVYKLIRRKDT